jgi:predicted enzyme related to lactoylglutathione lyase
MTEFSGLSTLGQIHMNAQDVERAKVFYRDVLGVPLLFEFPGLAFFDCDGVRLMLSRAEAPEGNHPGSILYSKVPDIEAAHAELTERGVEFVEAPHRIADMGSHELWMALFRDSGANLLALMTEKRT